MRQRNTVIFFCILVLSFISILSSRAQGTYGASSYFNFVYSSVSDWTGFAGAVTYKTVVNSDTLLFGGCDATGPTRVKGGFTGAIRATSIELPAFPSLGYLSFYIQNGSSGTTRTIYLKVWDPVSSAWITAETIPIGGNVDKRVVASSVLSKKGVKVKIDSDGKYFWFYQLEAWSSKLATTDPNALPVLLSVLPTPGSTLSSTDTVTLQYDELIKQGMGNLDFSGATLAPSFLGNTLQILYSHLTEAKDTLVIPSSFVRNSQNIPAARDTSFLYTNDVTDPVLQSVSPADSSIIHVNDIAGKIVLTFDETISLGTGSILFGPATVTSSFSGKTLTIGYSGLAYSTAYTLTIPADFIQDISGNTYKTDIVLHYTTHARDSTPPTLLSLSPLSDATNVPIGGSLSLAFSEIVQANGHVTLNGTPIDLSFNGSLVGINYTNLEYNTVYTVTIPSGSLTDTTGNPFPDTTFHFTTKPFLTKGLDIIVAKDGSGDYRTIQEAINAVPDNSADRTFVYVTNGIYQEKVMIPASKQNLSLIGQDSAKTILLYNDYAGGAGGTDNSYTIDIKPTGFYAENITFQNTWPTTGGSTNQAVALMTEGDKQVFKNCKVVSFQDSHYPKQPNTRQYYLNCFIQGATDFMFGSATAFFESSRINAVVGGQYLTAPSGTPREFGLVYNNCQLTANANVPAQSYYLGRPWKDFGKTVYLNTKMGPHIKDIGWAVWATAGDDADNQFTGFYAEYNSMDLTGNPINPIRATWGKKLTLAQAARYTIDNVFNYGTGSDSWNPLPFSTATEPPMNLTVNGGSLAWDAPKFAVGYVIFRNDTLIGTSQTSDFIDPDFISGATYRVKALNEYGAQSAYSDTPLSLDEATYAATNAIFPNPFTEFIFLKHSEGIKMLTFFTLDGQFAKEIPAAPIIETAELKSGFYLVRITSLDGIASYVKMCKK